MYMYIYSRCQENARMKIVNIQLALRIRYVLTAGKQLINVLIHTRPGRYVTAYVRDYYARFTAPE